MEDSSVDLKPPAAPTTSTRSQPRKTLRAGIPTTKTIKGATKEPKGQAKRQRSDNTAEYGPGTSASGAPATVAKVVKKARKVFLKSIKAPEWKEAIRKGSIDVFARLKVLRKEKSGAPASILERIHAGALEDTRPAGEKMQCFLVCRDGKGSTSPFQVQVSGARIVAQKTLYAAYNKLDVTQMGTWQVRQTCLHTNGSWWCFEPTHLERCVHDHIRTPVPKHPIPRDADAVYQTRTRPQDRNALRNTQYAPVDGSNSGATTATTAGMQDWAMNEASIQAFAAQLRLQGQQQVRQQQHQQFQQQQFQQQNFQAQQHQQAQQQAQQAVLRLLKARRSAYLVCT